MVAYLVGVFQSQARSSGTPLLSSDLDTYPREVSVLGVLDTGIYVELCALLGDCEAQQRCTEPDPVLEMFQR